MSPKIITAPENPCKSETQKPEHGDLFKNSMQTPSFSIEHSGKSPTTAPYGNRDTQGNKHLKQVHLSDYRNVLTDHFSKPRTKSRATEWLIKPSLNADGVRHETRNANTQTKFKTHRPQRWNATKHTVEPVRSIIFSRPVPMRTAHTKNGHRFCFNLSLPSYILLRVSGNECFEECFIHHGRGREEAELSTNAGYKSDAVPCGRLPARTDSPDSPGKFN